LSLGELELPSFVWPAALFSVVGIAVSRGGREERIAAAGVLVAWLLTTIVYRTGLRETQWPVLVIDSCLLVLYLWIALRSTRYWPLFTAGFKLLAVVTHIANYLDTGVSGWAYWTAEIIWSYLALFTIGYAAWTAPRYAVIDEADPRTAPGATRR
jgi:hypothetical protein